MMMTDDGLHDDDDVDDDAREDRMRNSTTDSDNEDENHDGTGDRKKDEDHVLVVVVAAEVVHDVPAKPEQEDAQNRDLKAMILSDFLSLGIREVGPSRLLPLGSAPGGLWKARSPVSESNQGPTTMQGGLSKCVLFTASS